MRIDRDYSFIRRKLHEIGKEKQGKVRADYLENQRKKFLAQLRYVFFLNFSQSSYAAGVLRNFYVKAIIA